MTRLDTVIADHEDFLVVYKPPECDFHDCDGKTGFFNQLQLDYSHSTLWPVHRLDKVTSGLMLVAKSKLACTNLCELFNNCQINKTYLALAIGKPKKKQGTVKGDMERSRRGTWKLLRSNSNPAITHFESVSVKPGLRLYLLRPKTGKTHQLRVAMKSLGVPILGDELYGGETFDRTYLHAAQLTFEYQGREYCFYHAPNEGSEFAHLEIPTFSGELSR